MNGAGQWHTAMDYADDLIGMVESTSSRNKNIRRSTNDDIESDTANFILISFFALYQAQHRISR